MGDIGGVNEILKTICFTLVHFLSHKKLTALLASKLFTWTPKDQNKFARVEKNKEMKVPFPFDLHYLGNKYFGCCCKKR